MRAAHSLTGAAARGSTGGTADADPPPRVRPLDQEDRTIRVLHLYRRFAPDVAGPRARVQDYLVFFRDELGGEFTTPTAVFDAEIGRAG